MRVALLVTDHLLGGTPLRFARIARGLHARGIDVCAGCLSPPGPVTAQLHADGIPTFAAEARHAGDWAAFARLAHTLERLQPDLIHSALVHANVAARLVGSWLGIPVLTSTATIEVEKRWHLWLERLTSPLDRGHLVHDAALVDHVRRHFGLAESKIHVTPPLIRTLRKVSRVAARAELELPADRWLVGWLGRDDPVKRVALVTQAVEMFPDNGVCAVLAGQRRNARPEARDATTAHGALSAQHTSSRLIELGWQADPSAFLHAIDVLMLPSRTEGVPNVAFEALACGVPVVSSALAALKNVPGVSIIKSSAPENFFSLLHDLRADPSLYARQAQAAHDWARGALDPKRALDTLVALYTRIIERRV